MTIPCQVGSGMRHLEHFRGNSVAGGRQERLPGTLSRGYRGRWAAGKNTWNAFAGKPWQVGGGKGDLERFCGNSVAGGRQERLPGTLSRGFRARWTAEKDTWNAFAGIPCQVDGKEGHLERFCGDSVAGGRQDGTPGTLLRGFRARWEAGRDTWNTFAGKPWQVEGGKRHLEHFRGKTVAGGRREETPGTLSRENRARWAAGKATWNAFAGIPWQVGGRKRHLKRFCRDSVPGGQRDGTPGTATARVR